MDGAHFIAALASAPAARALERRHQGLRESAPGHGRANNRRRGARAGLVWAVPPPLAILAKEPIEDGAYAVAKWP